jgi:prepilin-type N-terminal cleavage/methylation domain-containing protein
MRQRGFSLAELLVAIAIFMTLAAVAAPGLKAYSLHSQLVGAAREFKSRFMRCRSIAITSGRQTAIRFERTGQGVQYALYSDGNLDGVLSAEIAAGIDARIEGPYPLTSGAPDVRVEILPGVPAIPPERGTLDPSDPIRFGRAEMVSFSPDGTASPGTFYLAGTGQQAAVRVVPSTGRVRILICRGGAWSEQ